MNTFGKLTVTAMILLSVASTGYWLGSHSTATSKESAQSAQAERKILYYRNPMGLADTSATPKKDSMGMDYVAVYEGEQVAAGQINISNEKVQKLGVKSEPALFRELATNLRVTGRIEINEGHVYSISPKFEGWVEHLYVNNTGQTVRQGQPLFEVYSPELLSAKGEYALALQGLANLKDADDETKASMQRLADASRARLKNWDVADTPSLPSKDKSRIVFTAPVSGVVLEKKAVQGMRFMPGEALFQIADLSTLWLIADINEQDISQIKIGSQAQITVDALGGRVFDGKVSFIYPTLNSATRSGQIRIELNNSKGALKPAMFANVQIAHNASSKVLTVANSAVIDSGTKQIVLVRLAEGRFEPRVVSLGKRSDSYIEVLAGIIEGEQVVISANFLLDSESNLKAALSNMNERPQPSPAITESSKQSHTSVGHQAQGILESINADGTVSITHEPIKSLAWPSMTMDFALANTSLSSGVKLGSKISFEIVERTPGEWVITKLHLQHGGH
ncbi:MAG: efflux RND transporter periplasmic adaptor subunit [Gallionellaceae bacterium]|nr:efflux RND transporter periplasmic adaptor subunit [Gallionellaceae bacterium]